MRLLRSLCNWTVLGTAVAVCYVCIMGFQLYKATHPLYGVLIDPSEPAIDPLWKLSASMDMWCVLSTDKRFKQINLKHLDNNEVLLLHESDIMLEDISVPIVRSLNVSANIPSIIWKALQTNQTEVYMHVFAKRNSAILPSNDHGETNDVITQHTLKTEKWLYGVVPMVKVDQVPVQIRHRYLTNDLLAFLPRKFHDHFYQGDGEVPDYAILPADSKITYWKPEVAVRLVLDQTKYPASTFPPVLHRAVVVDTRQLPKFGPKSERRIQSRQGGSVVGYKPPFYVDEMGLTSDKYIPLNNSVRALPMTLTISSMSLQRWLLMTQMELGLKQQQEGLGFSNRDVDDVRRLVADTSPTLLGLTILASILHLLFEFLALQSDVSFWKSNNSLTGLSVRAVIIEFFFQSVIFLYLLDEDTSLLVTFPSAVGLCIQAWKIWRATGFQMVWKEAAIPSVRFARWEQAEKGDSSDLTRKTLEVDRKAVIHLTACLLPICVGFALRSLVFEKHKGWYSWAVGALTSCTYTFGFVLMTPQLFINHKLRSVAHLPWKFLGFRFVNTFIDDLFAFIIKMPTMHRLSVFRDDFVFLIYLYQRWIYPVDSTRPQETG